MHVAGTTFTLEDSLQPRHNVFDLGVVRHLTDEKSCEIGEQSLAFRTISARIHDILFSHIYGDNFGRGADSYELRKNRKQ